MIDFTVVDLQALHAQKVSKVIKDVENLMTKVTENTKVIEMHIQDILQAWF